MVHLIKFLGRCFVGFIITSVLAISTVIALDYAEALTRFVRNPKKREKLICWIGWHGPLLMKTDDGVNYYTVCSICYHKDPDRVS